MDVDELTRSLYEYNPTVNAVANQIVGGVRPVAAIIIGAFFLIEMMSWSKYLKQENGTMSMGLWLEISWKYIVAYILVMHSTYIFNAILEIFNVIIKIADGAVASKNVNLDYSAKDVSGWIERFVLKLIGGIIKIVGDFSAKVILTMRFFQMYLLKCVAPVIIAFFVNDSTRSLAVNVLKYFGMFAIQGFILLIVLRLYPLLITSSLFQAKLSGDYSSWSVAVSSMVKGIVFIFMLFGSQRLAKSLMQVN